MADEKLLDQWKETVERDEQAWSTELQEMDIREALYDGTYEIQTIKDDISSASRSCYHVRNIVAENIETQIDTTIPMPKITARREKHRYLAKIVEDMLRNEMDRMPMEQINDMAERTVRIQGATLYLCEWDNTKVTHDCVGQVVISNVHPMQLVPQSGINTDVDEMDHVAIKATRTRKYIQKQYGVDVSEEEEQNPEIRGDGKGAVDGLVTQYIVLYRNENGGIGRYSWVNDTELENIKDINTRRIKRCSACNTPESAAILSQSDPSEPLTCPICGGKKFEYTEEEYEEIYQERELNRPDGSQLVLQPGLETGMETGLEALGVQPAVGAKVPRYKPHAFPLVLQKNVSKFGQLLGESDADKIKDQQNTIKLLEQKLLNRIFGCGSLLILPPDVKITVDATDQKVVRPKNQADAAMIQVRELKGDLQYELAMIKQAYEESRQILGITDSYQGRRDTTATSGYAKELSASQAAGRMESKRIMKKLAYAKLYQIIFENMLAYCDEPWPMQQQSQNGETEYTYFDRWDFLDVDEAGNYYWVDDFIFDCDDASMLAGNRSAMWNQTTQTFQSGGFGNPADLNTLVLYWDKMAQLSYPGAADTRKKLQEQLDRQLQQMQQQTQVPPAATPIQSMGEEGMIHG